MTGQQRRTKGSGSVYQTTDHFGRPRWRCEIRVADPTAPSGKRKITGTGPDYLTAQTRFTKKLLDFQNGQDKEPKPKQAVKVREPRHRKTNEKPKDAWYFREYAQWWSDRRTGIADSTKRQDWRRLENHIFDHLGNLEIRSITTKKIRQLLWNDFLYEHTDEKGLLENAYKTLHKVFAAAIRDTIITVNPMTPIDKPKSKSGIPEWAMMDLIAKTRALNGWLTKTDKDGKPLYESVCGTAYYLRIRLAMLGLRPAEALGLTWDRVFLYTGKNKTPYIVVNQNLTRDEKTGKLFIRTDTKTKTGRTVPLDSHTVDVMKKWKKDRAALEKKNGWKFEPGLENLVVVREEDGWRLDMNSDQIIWQNLLRTQQKRTKPENQRIFPVGTVRHISATVHLDAGANPLQVAKSWGHSLEVQ